MNKDKPDLSSIEPIGKLPDEERPENQINEAERVGRTAAVVSGTPPAVGVESITLDAGTPSAPGTPTAPSDEEHGLEKLRRG